MKCSFHILILFVILVVFFALQPNLLFAQKAKPMMKSKFNKPHFQFDHTYHTTDDDSEEDSDDTEGDTTETDNDLLSDDTGDDTGDNIGLTQNQLTEIDLPTDSYNLLNISFGMTDAPNEVADTLSAFNLGQAAMLGDIAFNSSGHWTGNGNRYGSLSTTAVFRGQVPRSPAKPPVLYVQPYYKTIKTDARDAREGYGITKTGFLSGLTVDTDSSTSVGVLFGYANPELYRTDRQVQMNDFHVGMMLVKSLPHKMDFGALFSMGWQDGHTNRYVTGLNPANDLVRYRFRGDLSGHTFNATANLGKRIEIGRHFLLKPTVGVDYEGMWLSSFTEEMDGNAHLTGTPADNLMARRSYDDGSFRRVLFKVGLATSFAGSKGGISGKVFYGTQLGGNDFASVDATIMDGYFVGERRHDTSLPIGRDFVYLDGGIHHYINEKKTALLFASYNATLYSQTTDQTILLGLRWMK